MRRHRWRIIVACLLALTGVWMVDGSPVRDAAASAFPFATIRDVRFNRTLEHNITNLMVQRGDRPFEVPFLATYEQTGGLTRWGLATSEVMEEEPGSLTQYYQRGILDWHSSSTCGTPDGFCMQRRLAWDFFGGGLDGSPDLGVEPSVLSSAPGTVDGPWRHRISNTSIEGDDVQFFQFYQRYGGRDSFGYPKTEARRDTNGPGTVHIDAATPGFTRQYFQAAVMEYHKGDPEPVKLRLLGDDLRDRSYPGDAWKAFRSFRSTTELRPGSPYAVERVFKGPRTLQGQILDATSVVTRCKPDTWRAGQTFCASDAVFQPAPAGTQLLTGDAVRTGPRRAQAWPESLLKLLGGPAPSSPGVSVDTEEPVVLAMLRAGLVRGVAWLRDGTYAFIHTVAPGDVAMTISEGEVALAIQSGENLYFLTPDGQIETTGTVLLIRVDGPPGNTTSTVKVVEGSVRVRPIGAANSAAVQAGQEVRVARGGALAPQPINLSDPVDKRMVDLANGSKSLLGKPPGSVQPSGGGARPTVTINLDPTQASTGVPVMVRITASDDTGLQSISWTAQRTGNNGNDNSNDPDAAQDHPFDCKGQRECGNTWSVPFGSPGTYTFTAIARDTGGQQSDPARAVLQVRRLQGPG